MNISQVTIELLKQQTPFKYSNTGHQLQSNNTPHRDIWANITRIFAGEPFRPYPICIAHIYWHHTHCTLITNPQTQPDTIYHYHNPEYPQNLINDINNLNLSQIGIRSLS